MKLNLKNPIVFFDLETTGTNINSDRIVEICYLKVYPNGNEESKTMRINPEMHIPAEASAVHGIYDEDVADCPTFKEVARSIANDIEGCDLAGFNSNRFDIPVLAYGLKNDFKNELFEGSYYMLIYADKIEEIKTICWCGRKATMVARVVDGKFVKSGEQILVGGDDMYVSLCRRHYNEGSLGPNGGRLTPVNTKFLETPHMDSEKE